MQLLATDCRAAPALPPSPATGSFVQPTAQRTLLATHTGSNINESTLYFVVKKVRFAVQPGCIAAA